MVNKTSGNIDFSEKIQIKCLKKDRKNNNYNFFLSSYTSTIFISSMILFAKSINLSNNNHRTSINMAKVQLTINV